MTELLDKTMIAVQQLPPEQQDVIATLILEELADDLRWDAAFAQSQDALAQLAAKARTDMRGSLADLGTAPSDADITDVQRDMWATLL